MNVRRESPRMPRATKIWIGFLLGLCPALLLVDLTATVFDGTDGSALSPFAMSMHGMARILAVLACVAAVAVWILSYLRLLYEKIEEATNGEIVMPQPRQVTGRVYRAHEVFDTVALPTLAQPMPVAVRRPAPLPAVAQGESSGQHRPRRRGRRRAGRGGDSEDPPANVRDIVKDFGIYLAAKHDAQEDMRREQEDRG